MAAELVGNGVKLISADELVSSDGTRQQAALSDRASKAFTEEFTQNYADIARPPPVYTELRNIIDLAIVAAFMRITTTARPTWKLATLLRRAGSYAVETHQRPHAGRDGRGQRMEGEPADDAGRRRRANPAQQASSRQQPAPTAKASHEPRRKPISLDGLHPGQWWWD